MKKVWQRPAAWLPQGSAVHTVLEIYQRKLVEGLRMDLEAAKDLFREEYSKEVGRYCDITPNFEYWSRSGQYGGEVDIERRYGIGLEQIEKYFAWVESHPDEVIWVAPDGTPGIELEFDIQLDEIWVRGFIDGIYKIGSAKDSRCKGEHVADCECRDGELRVRDYKTGNSPGDDFQLGVYGVAVAEMFGIEPPKLGDYYMAGKQGKPGKPTHPYNLGEWPKEKVAERFRELEENIQAGRFEPAPEPSRCQFCDVSSSCEYRLD